MIKDSSISYVQHVVTDMGNGGAFCSNCQHWLGADPFKIPDMCTKCKLKLIECGDIYINQGGYDFNYD
jgi:predicted Zn-ribbon and HTH transcriptional regulator